MCVGVKNLILTVKLLAPLFLVKKTFTKKVDTSEFLLEYNFTS